MNPNELPPVVAPDEVPPPAAKKKKSHGCLWALLISFVVLVLLAVVGLIAAFSLWKSAVRNYTATAPLPIPVVAASKEEAKAITDRAMQFFQDLKAGQPVEPLILTADDLNRLIASSGSNQMAGKLFVTIEDGKVKGRMCFPLDQTHNKDLQGRYLNADVTLRATLQDGELRVWADEIQANDQAIPGIVLSQIQQRNLAEEYMKTQDAYATMLLLESITVTNGAIVITPKP